MSFSISFSGHIEPADPAKDAYIRKCARAFADLLRAGGVECSGSVYTPSNPNGGSLDLPTATLDVSGGKLHVHPDGPGGGPTGTGHPKP